jgi:magnesium transporter
MLRTKSTKLDPPRTTPLESRRSLEFEGLTWIDIPNPTAQDLMYLEERYQFHPPGVEDLSEDVQRPKLEEYPDYLFLLAHFPLFDATQRVTYPAELQIYVGGDFVITVRTGKIKPLDRLYDRLSGSDEAREDVLGKGGGYLLFRLLDTLVDHFFPVALKIEHNVQRLESQIFDAPGRKTVEEISTLRRDIIAFRRIVKGLIPVVERLERIRSNFVRTDLGVYFSDIEEALERLWHALDDQDGILQTLSDTHDSLTNHRTNDIIRTLTTLSALMLPLTLVSGVFGMNVRLPFESVPYAFGIITGLMIGVAAAMLAVFKLKRWL